MKKDHLILLLEDLNSKFDFLLEIVTNLAPLPGQVAAIEERLARVESDVKIIKKVVIEHSSDIKQLKNAAFST